MIFTHTKTGDRHLVRNKPCDDAVAAVSTGSYSFMVISDGCSSSAYGSEAAHRITQRLVDMVSYPDKLMDNPPAAKDREFMAYCIKEGNEEHFMQMVLHRVNEETELMIKHYNCCRKDLCATLIAALVYYDSKTRKNTAVILTIGDGFVAAYKDKTMESTLVSRGENRQGNPNMTYFATSCDAAEHTNLYRIDNFDNLLISTDGITHAVDIDSYEELGTLMELASTFPCMNDREYSVLMNKALETFLQLSPDRDLDDDCSSIYYTTCMHRIKKRVKNNKIFKRR